MPRPHQWLAASFACGVFLAGGFAQAQTRVERVERVEQERGTVEVHANTTRRVSSVLGSKVSIQGNLTVGKVEDLVLSENGTVEYLVVQNDDKYVLIPWNAATPNFETRIVTVEIPQEKFREVPTFTRGHWPNLKDTTYVEKLHTTYGVRPGQERRIERREERRRP